MESLREQMAEINRLSSELDGIYHEVAAGYGLSDSVFWILYELYENRSAVAQKDLCNHWYYSKQTVNSAVATMVRMGWVTLRMVPGTRNRKDIVLTEAGREFCGRTVGSIQKMEMTVYARFTAEERRQFLTLFRRMNGYMKEELEREEQQ